MLKGLQDLFLTYNFRLDKDLLDLCVKKRVGKELERSVYGAGLFLCFVAGRHL